MSRPVVKINFLNNDSVSQSAALRMLLVIIFESFTGNDDAPLAEWAVKLLMSILVIF